MQHSRVPLRFASRSVRLQSKKNSYYLMMVELYSTLPRGRGQASYNHAVITCPLISQQVVDFYL
jgi:hypothetical protein